jgi:branched-subunit amino acid aminotransferase/4-amino-4-deoxychorismate lyase
MTARIFLNGEWLAAGDARVSVMDRGFLFGDGVYEVIPVYSRQALPPRTAPGRLQQSLDGIQLANPHRPDEWIGFVTQLAKPKPNGKTSRSTSRSRAGRWRCATTPSRKR